LDDQSVFTDRSRPPVAFPHIQHIDAEIECSDCHHRFKGGENIVDEAELEEDAEGIKCSSCHKNETGFQFKPDLDPTKRNLQQAYHRMCTGCHRQVSKDKKQSGPVTCGECHPKKKGSTA
jgi:c(7)-type cytochrome triheme protein